MKTRLFVTLLKQRNLYLFQLLYNIVIIFNLMKLVYMESAQETAQNVVCSQAKYTLKAHHQQNL